MGTGPTGGQRLGTWTEPFGYLEAEGNHEASKQLRVSNCLCPSLLGAGHRDTASQDTAAGGQRPPTNQTGCRGRCSRGSQARSPPHPTPCTQGVQAEAGLTGDGPGDRMSTGHCGASLGQAAGRSRRGEACSPDTNRIPGGRQRRVPGQEGRPHGGSGRRMGKRSRRRRHGGQGPSRGGRTAQQGNPAGARGPRL